MNKILFALIASATALTGVTAHAADAGTGYVGAGIVGSRYNFDVPVTSATDDHSGNKASGKIFAGYNIDKTFAVEGGYTDFGSQSYNYTLNGADGHLQSDSHSFYVAGKASAPINEQVAVFGKLGAARNHDGVSGSGAAAGVQGDSKTGLYASVGAQYALNKNVALTAELEHYGKGGDFGRKSSALAVGARYSF